MLINRLAQRRLQKAAACSDSFACSTISLRGRLLADYCATLDHSRRAPAPCDPPAPCDGRTAPHAWPSTHQPCQQHCMATRSMRLGARVRVGRACDAPRTSLPRRQACASACCTTPAGTSYVPAAYRRTRGRRGPRQRHATAMLGAFYQPTLPQELWSPGSWRSRHSAQRTHGRRL